MAGDDNESKHAASGLPPERTLHQPTTEPTVVETSSDFPTRESTALPGAAATEWTASDARGPLNEAKPQEAADLATARRETSLHEAITQAATTEAPTTPTGSADAGPPKRAVPTGSVAPRKSGAFPIAAGIVLGAVIGAGSAYYIYATRPDLAADRIAAIASRLDALDKKPDAQQTIAPLQAAIEDLKMKVATADATARSASALAAKIAANPPGDTSAMAAKLAALESAVGGFKQTASPMDDIKALQEKLASTDGKVGGLAAKIPTLAADLKTLQDKLAPMDATTAALQKQAAGTQADVQTLQTGQKSLEGKITSAPALAVVSDSLVSQIKRGLPFTQQVIALESLGVDPAKIALLRQWSDQGVPTAKTLEDKFDPLVDGMLAAPAKTTGTPSFLDRMREGLGSMVAVRRVDDTGGDDLASRIARIKAELAHDDVIAAVTTWNALPPDTKTKPDAVAWGALAKTHADALAAANAVESGAIAALGPKKS